jgi:hypothetical protein
MTSASPQPDLPDWTQEALKDPQLSDAQRQQVQWIGEVYQLFVSMSSFSLSEYTEQLQNMDRVGEFSQKGLMLAQKAKALTEAIRQQQ